MADAEEKEIWELSTNELVERIVDNKGMTLLCVTDEDYVFWRDLIKNKLCYVRIDYDHKTPCRIRIISDGWRKDRHSLGIMVRNPRSSYGGEHYIYKSFPKNSAPVTTALDHDLTRYIDTETKYGSVNAYTNIITVQGILPPSGKDIQDEIVELSEINAYREQLIEGIDYDT
jgi:hypothetical protein